MIEVNTKKINEVFEKYYNIDSLYISSDKKEFKNK